MRTREEQPPIARLTVQGPRALTAEEAHELVAWLRKQAHQLEHERADYTDGRYTARLYL